MNRSRKRAAGVPGQLWTLQDGHISRGGDIERRKRFVSTFTLPSGSHYLAAIRSQLYTFGSGDLSSTTPAGVSYQRLLPYSKALLYITSAQNAGNNETVVINGKTYTFKTVLSNTDGFIFIGASRIATLTNLAHAINLSGGTPGTDYAAATTIHPTVSAVDHLDGTITLRAKTAGSGGDALTLSETLAQGAFNPTSTLGGGAAAMTRVLDAKPFHGKMYVIAEYDDGNIYHFYDGSRVVDWDVAVTPSANDVALRLAAVLDRTSAVSAEANGAVVLVTARVPGTAFTLTAGVTDGGADSTQALTRAAVTANVAAVAETLADADITITAGTNDPGANTVSSVKANNVEILAAVVDWAGSHAATAARVVTEINNGTAVHGYSAAIVSGAQLRISAAPGTGDTPNGYALDVVTTGDVTVTSDATFTGGVDEVDAVAQVDKLTVSGTVEREDTFTATLNATAYKVTGLSAGMGTSLYIDKQRVWSTAGSLWRYCMLGTATVWDPSSTVTDADAGFLDISEETEGNDNVVIATRYQNLAAVLSQSFISLYGLDTDPANFAISDTLDNTGTTSPRSVVRYGNNDVFYLDTSGIRSLRARDASNAPFISDVGNAIDEFVKETLAELTPAEVLDAVGAIEPKDGRLWVAAGGYIFVLSYFPGSKVSAWSYYLPTEFGSDSIECMVRANKRMYVRAGNTAFLYGGLTDDEYPEADESPCLVEIPFLSANTPATFKEFWGFDIACENAWDVDVLYDPNDEDRTINIGTVTKTTFNELHITLSGNTTMVGLKLECSRAGAASISAIMLHYVKEGRE